MNEQLIERILPELKRELVGLSFRQMFQLSEQRFAIAFEGEEFKLLFVAIEPKEPRIYLIKRRMRELKKQSQHPSKFVVDTENSLTGKRLAEVSKHANERIVELRFESEDANYLIVQLTGKSSNLFVLDPGRKIVAAAKKPEREQTLGVPYSAPERTGPQTHQNDHDETPLNDSHRSISESLDTYFSQREEQVNFETLAKEARRKNQKAQTKLRRLIKNLETDVVLHGDPQKWKKFGDLLLANQANAKRKAGSIIVPDLFEDDEPLIAIEADERDSPADAAQKYFRKYAKARSAAAEVASRIETVRLQLTESENEAVEIEIAIESGDVDFLNEYVEGSKKPEAKAKEYRVSRLRAGLRSFRSSDGFEILVGKKATDNDFLTFRIANSRDTWMHSADYPGSHVVIRNPDRREVPQKTLIEAAQLAAFYSQGKKQVKAAVNYTEKKFVNKPKGTAPGLVRLASFKTILVEPAFPNVLKS